MSDTPNGTAPLHDTDLNADADTNAAADLGQDAHSTVFVVMGVSGVGKTTTAQALAARLGWAIGEGDAFHPRSTWPK